MMKDVMVHLDGTAEDEVRLAHAEELAVSRQARVIGLYTISLPEYAYVMAVQSQLASMEPILELDQQLHDNGDVVAQRLAIRFDRLSVPNEIRRVEAKASEISGLCTTEARFCDLFVATVPYRREELPVWDDLIENLVFDVGHGIYLVPPDCPVRSPIRNVLVAWQDTRESTRAVAAAMPILEAAARIRIVMVKSLESEVGGEEGMDIAAHLGRHGAQVDIVATERPAAEVADALLQEAEKMSADLIVMGAYGHSRLREWAFGGVTRGMLERAEIPILLSH